MKGGCPVTKINRIIAEANKSLEAPSYLIF